MKDSSIVNRTTCCSPRRSVKPVHPRSAHPAIRRACVEALEGRRLLSFSAAVAYPVGYIAEDVLTADFNADGRLDLAVANYGDSTVGVLLGNADGTFQPQQTSATGIWPMSLAVGDFNADGKLDLTSVSAGNGSVSVLLGNGNGTFQASTPGYTGSATSVAVGDFNADGKLDLGVTLNLGYAYYGSVSFYGAVAVLLGNGDGSFAAPQATWLLGDGQHTSAVAADFNGDGNLDFASASGSVNIVFGDGTGDFGSPVAVPVRATAYSDSVIAADVNADGKVDLVTVGGDDKVCVVLGTGLGTFAAAQYHPVGATPYAVAAADFNGDGKVDIATANELAGTVSVLIGAGNGSFGVAQNFAVGTEPQSLGVGDFNGDRLMDLAVANQRSDNISVLLNRQPWPAPNAPSVSIGDAAVTEGNAGTTSATFTVSLSAAYDRIVSVDYATADGSATAGGDYEAKSGTLTFGIGETSKTITVAVNGDRLGEDAEFFKVGLGNPVNAFFFTDPTGFGEITDDEPHVTIYGATVIEGNTGTRAALFTVELDREYDVDVNVDYFTADGSAAAGIDYQSASGTLTIPAGQTSRTISVLISGDRVVERTEYYYPYSYFENNEYFGVNLNSSDHATITASHAFGVIEDDEPRISVNNVSVTEGDRGTKLMTFTVSLAAVYDQPVTVRYDTQDGSAVAGVDYTAASGTLTFAAGQTTKTFTVAIKGDKQSESQEYFLIRLTNASINAWIAQDGSGTIFDNDGRGRKS